LPNGIDAKGINISEKKIMKNPTNIENEKTVSR
jgi:hypothetical protein